MILWFRHLELRVKLPPGTVCFTHCVAIFGFSLKENCIWFLSAYRTAAPVMSAFVSDHSTECMLETPLSRLLRCVRNKLLVE